MTRKQVCFKMDTELLKELDECAGTRTDNIAMAVQAYLSRTSTTSTHVRPNEKGTQDVNTAIQEEKIRSQAELLAAKEAQIVDLQTQNGWLMSQYSELQKIALPPPKAKRRWQIWKERKKRQR